jgi:hypothetical protein
MTTVRTIPGVFFIEATFPGGHTFLFGRRDGRPFQSRDSAIATIAELEAQDRAEARRQPWSGRPLPVYHVRNFLRIDKGGN